MRTTLFILSLFGILFVSGCGGEVKNAVLDAEGKTIGQIQLENENSATILNAREEVVGKVRGNVIRDGGSKKLGTAEVREGTVVIIDAEDNEVGSIEDSVDCYGKSQEKLGSVGTNLDPEAAAAACLILLIQA